jgi:hypothetical protein
MKRFLTASKIAHRSSHESDRSALEEAVYWLFVSERGAPL